jgi:hypothetical protein
VPILTDRPVYFKTVNVCLVCGREWNEVMAFEQRPVGKIFGVCGKCKIRLEEDHKL